MAKGIIISSSSNDPNQNVPIDEPKLVEALHGISGDSPSGLSSHQVKNNAISGMKALSVRTLASLILRVISSVYVARVLIAQDYGIFSVVSYIVGFSAFLTDVGLGSALVRQHNAPTKDESFTVFISQQTITLVVVLAVVLSGAAIVHAERLPISGIVMLDIMAGSLFLSSLRVMPMMAMERSLQFPLIAKCGFIEMVAQTIATIACAKLGLGAWSFVWGNVVRGVVGLVCVLVASPWRPDGSFKFDIFTKLAKFGIPYQLSAIVPTIAGGWSPILVGRILGVSALGYVGWASNIASIPLTFTGVLVNVSFPSFSRLQDDVAVLGRFLTTSIKRTSTIAMLLIPAAVILAPVLVPLVFKPKWIPAVGLIQWFLFECMVATTTVSLASAQTALGRANERLGVTIGIAIFRWCGGFAAVKLFGLAGIGPIMTSVSMIELVITTALMRTHEGKPLVNFVEIVAPVLTNGVVIAAALFGGMLLAHGSSWLSALISLLIVTALYILRKILGFGDLLAETSQLISLLSNKTASPSA